MKVSEQFNATVHSERQRSRVMSLTGLPRVVVKQREIRTKDENQMNNESSQNNNRCQHNPCDAETEELSRLVSDSL